MSSSKRSRACAVLVTALLGVLAGCESGTSEPRVKRFILISNGNSPFWDACRAGLNDAVKELNLQGAGLTAVLEVNEGDPQGQITKLRQFSSQSDIVGIALSAIDASNAAVAQEMRNLQKKGVHVICVDSDFDRKMYRDARSYYLGTDNLLGGRALGIAAKQLLAARSSKPGSYVQFVGRTGAQNAMDRMDGFSETVGASFKEVDRSSDEFDRSRARENVRNALRNHPELVALVGIYSHNGPAIVDVLKDEKKSADYTVVSFDAEATAIRQMGEGLIDAMVVQDPYAMGYESVRLLKAMYEKDTETIKKLYPNEGQPDGDLYDTGLKVVVPDENSSLRADMFSDNTQFLKLSEFKTWLAKYKLTSS